MNSILRVKIVLVFVVMLAAQKALAQFTPSKWEIGINAGTLIYQGDLSGSSLGYTNCFKPSVELWVSRSLDPYFSIRANLLQGSLDADESTYAGPAWRSTEILRLILLLPKFPRNWSGISMEKPIAKACADFHLIFSQVSVLPSWISTGTGAALIRLILIPTPRPAWTWSGYAACNARVSSGHSRWRRFKIYGHQPDLYQRGSYLPDHFIRLY